MYSEKSVLSHTSFGPYQVCPTDTEKIIEMSSLAKRNKLSIKISLPS